MTDESAGEDHQVVSVRRLDHIIMPIGHRDRRPARTNWCIVVISRNTGTNPGKVMSGTS